MHTHARPHIGTHTYRHARKHTGHWASLCLPLLLNWIVCVCVCVCVCVRMRRLALLGQNGAGAWDRGHVYALMEHFHSLPHATKHTHRQTHLLTQTHRETCINQLHAHTHSHLRSHTLSHTHTYTNTPTHTLSHTHTRTLSLSHILMVAWDAGKSTTMNMLCGFTRPSAGNAFMYGLSIRHDMSELRDCMGVCPQVHPPAED
jgi:ABC-type transport system involved in cytochrome bd biosynthesis fused ATPase/permease subunit